MKKIVDYFDRAYIINLVDRTDRKQQAEKEFRDSGMAIPSEKTRFYPAIRPRDPAGFKDVGTRGNFTSHKDVLALAVNDNLKNVLILEDDVSFRHISDDFQSKVLTELSSQKWDFVYFGYLAPSDEHLKGPLTLSDGDVIGAHFYAVNGHFMSTMLQYMEDCERRPRDHPLGGPMTADGAYNHVRYVFPELKAFLSVPSLAHQRSSRTDVAPVGKFDRISALQPILPLARRIKHYLRMASDAKALRRRFDD